jgi:hypothetical protein
VSSWFAPIAVWQLELLAIGFLDHEYQSLFVLTAYIATTLLGWALSTWRSSTCSRLSHCFLKIIASKADTSVHLSTEEVTQIRA